MGQLHQLPATDADWSAVTNANVPATARPGWPNDWGGPLPARLPVAREDRTVPTEAAAPASLPLDHDTRIARARDALFAAAIWYADASPAQDAEAEASLEAAALAYAAITPEAK